jgi:hypothetical protein
VGWGCCRLAAKSSSSTAVAMAYRATAPVLRSLIRHKRPPPKTSKKWGYFLLFKAQILKGILRFLKHTGSWLRGSGLEHISKHSGNHSAQGLWWYASPPRFGPNGPARPLGTWLVLLLIPPRALFEGIKVQPELDSKTSSSYSYCNGQLCALSSSLASTGGWAENVRRITSSRSTSSSVSSSSVASIDAFGSAKTIFGCWFERIR